MASRYVALVAALLFVLVGARGYAHHPFAAEFDVTKPVTLTGTVVSFDWRNPHSALTVDVADTRGTARWELELDSPNVLTSLGWTMSQFKPGDRVTVDGWLARDGSRRVSARSVVTNNRTLMATATLPDAPRTRTATSVPGTANEVVFVGCVETEDVYRQITRSGRGGVLETGFGKADEFVLMQVDQLDASSNPRPVGTSGRSDRGAMTITGNLEKGLVRAIGRQVLVVGKFESSGDLPQFNVTLWHPISDFCAR